MTRAWLQRAAAASILAVAAAQGIAGVAVAESAWVKDEIRLNLRTGPGTSFRIVAAIETGDAVEVLERRESWTRVRIRDGDEGWIPAGYLQDTMPDRLRVARFEAEAAELRERVAELTQESARLEEENAGLSDRDGEREQEIARLTRENLGLRAGARWPEWIAGAAILATGMLIGAWLQSRGRSSKPRVRL